MIHQNLYISFRGNVPEKMITPRHENHQVLHGALHPFLKKPSTAVSLWDASKVFWFVTKQLFLCARSSPRFIAGKNIGCEPYFSGIDFSNHMSGRTNRSILPPCCKDKVAIGISHHGETVRAIPNAHPLIAFSAMNVDGNCPVGGGLCHLKGKRTSLNGVNRSSQNAGEEEAQTASRELHLRNHNHFWACRCSLFIPSGK